MRPDLKVIVEHDATEECVACRAQQVVDQALIPAAGAWEAAAELPRHAVALHGAAELLGTMLADGVSRSDIDEALTLLLDDIERQIAEDRAMGGPTRGSA